jgi:hypothetical protein
VTNEQLQLVETLLDEAARLRVQLDELAHQIERRARSRTAPPSKELRQWEKSLGAYFKTEEALGCHVESALRAVNEQLRQSPIRLH